MSERGKHTPGPWEMDPFIRSTHIVWGPDGQAVCALEDRGGTMIANAYLISAAPDLLAALEALTPILEAAESNASGNPEWSWVSPRINAARAAVAKAKGDA